MTEAVCVAPAAPPLEDEIRRMKAEVDALQVHAMAEDRPWYLQMSALVSIFALAVSIFSAWASYDLAKRQNLREDRAELRELLQRLHAMPRENIELLVKYRDQPLVANQLSSVLNSENAALSTQALGIIDRIPDAVTSSERLAVAGALQNSGRIREALEIHEAVAGSEAATANDVLAAYRTLGANFFMLGEIEQGRHSFDQARGVLETRFKREHKSFKLFSNVTTELYQAQAEAYVRACPEAAEHVDAAATLIASRPELFAPICTSSWSRRGRWRTSGRAACRSRHRAWSCSRLTPRRPRRRRS